jgi:AraC-like DNA-binding protein
VNPKDVGKILPAHTGLLSQEPDSRAEVLHATDDETVSSLLSSPRRPPMRAYPRDDGLSPSYMAGGPRSAYPKGVKYPMPAAWKALVRARLESLGWSLTDLATQIGADKAAVVRAINSDQATSVLVPVISDILEIQRPFADEDELRLLERFRLLSEDGKQAVEALLRVLVRSPSKGDGGDGGNG